jgi:hypothetical protein
MTVCIQCSMEALAKGLPPPVFEEAPAEHYRRVHPNGVTPAERDALVRQIAQLVQQDRGEA